MLSPSGSDLYIGGYFTSIGGGPTHNRIAKISAAGTGIVDDNFAPSANNTVYTLALSGTDLYAGGVFTSPYNKLAKFTGSTGVVASWNSMLTVNDAVYSLALSGTDLYVGGDFTSIGGQTRKAIAKMGANTAVVDINWAFDATDYYNSSAVGPVYALAISGTDLYLGGSFGRLGGKYLVNFGRIGTNIPLPVVLSSFTAKAEGRRAKIEWATASEQNNDRFEVEKSTDGITFSALSSVKATGNGTSSTANNYSVYDANPSNGTAYYRLMQYDNDGTPTNHGMKHVTFKLAQTSVQSVYPNPSQGDFSISLAGITAEHAQIQISNMSGKKVWDKTYSIKDGYVQIKLDHAIPAGEYILNITAGSTHQETRKLMIVK